MYFFLGADLGADVGIDVGAVTKMAVYLPELLAVVEIRTVYLFLWLGLVTSQEVDQYWDIYVWNTPISPYVLLKN